jgi:aspartyl-tRNA(Asn)/glutamyl-tRNA(Gln) amidotransferase subunit A
MSTHLTITDAAAALRAGETTSVELVEQAVAAADSWEPELGSFITRFVDESLGAAAAADELIRSGAEVGVLHGIPLGIKDIITTAEGPSTAQSAVMDPAWSHGDAVVVARLRAAGGIVTGKTSTMEYACGLPDATKPFPVPRNPWALDTWPGGSSSGTGSGVAAGLFLGGLGTDTGGSIRIPSTFCGISGLMPTFGRVPKSGCVPLGYSLDHIGPMARSARDCALMLSVLAGHDASDLSSIDEPVPDYLAALSGDLAGVRIGVDRLARVAGATADPALDSVLDAALAELETLGAELVEIELPMHAEVGATLGPIVGGEMLAYHRPDAQSRLADYVASNRLQLGKQTFFSGADYVQAQRVRRVAQSRLAALYRDVDIVFTPTASIGAIALDELGDDFMPFFANIHTAYWDVLGNPVISVPAGFTAAGRPLGVQFAGRPFDEAAVLRVADAYQQVTAWHLERPELPAAAAA